MVTGTTLTEYTLLQKERGKAQYMCPVADLRHLLSLRKHLLNASWGDHSLLVRTRQWIGPRAPLSGDAVLAEEA